MKLHRQKISRLKTLFRLIESILAPIIWVCNKEYQNGGYFRFQSLSEYLNWISEFGEEFIMGYYDYYSFDDEYFLTYEEVFGEK